MCQSQTCGWLACHRLARAVFSRCEGCSRTSRHSCIAPAEDKFTLFRCGHHRPTLCGRAPFAHSQDLLRHPQPQAVAVVTARSTATSVAASSMDGCVDDQDYNDGAQNDHPIGKLNARYRCPFTKPFHGYPPIFKQRLTKGETRRKVRGRGLAMALAVLRLMALAVLRLMTSTNLVLACFSGHLGGCLDFCPSTVRTKSLPSFVSATLRLRLHAPS